VCAIMRASLAFALLWPMVGPPRLRGQSEILARVVRKDSVGGARSG